MIIELLSFVFKSTAEEFLASASNKLSRKQLRFAATNVKALHEEFWVS